MSNPRYPEEFKIQAVNQVTEKKLPVADVAARLDESPLAKPSRVHAVFSTSGTSLVINVLGHRIEQAPRSSLGRFQRGAVTSAFV